MLREAMIITKLIVRTDSSAAKQSVEKVGLLHVKHMAMRMLFLKDLQREGQIEVQRVAGTQNPADMFTKPLTADAFQKCRNMLVGVEWKEANVKFEVGMIEAQHRCSAVGFQKESVTDYSIVAFMLQLPDHVWKWMKLALMAHGLFAVARHRCCTRRATSRTVAVQSQCT